MGGPQPGPGEAAMASQTGVADFRCVAVPGRPVTGRRDDAGGDHGLDGVLDGTARLRP